MRRPAWLGTEAIANCAQQGNFPRGDSLVPKEALRPERGLLYADPLSGELMKTLISLTLLAILATSPVHADSPRLTTEDYLNLLRIDMRASKARAVADAMDLTPDESKAFWRVYGDYDAAMSKLNADRISLLREFAARYSEIDDAMAADLSQRSFDFMQRRLDLLQKHSRRLAKAISPTIAARFAQIEHHLQMLLDVQLAAEFPLIPRTSDLATTGVW